MPDQDSLRRMVAHLMGYYRAKECALLRWRLICTTAAVCTVLGAGLFSTPQGRDAYANSGAVAIAIGLWLAYRGAARKINYKHDRATADIQTAIRSLPEPERDTLHSMLFEAKREADAEIRGLV